MAAKGKGKTPRSRVTKGGYRRVKSAKDPHEHYHDTRPSPSR